MDSNNIVMSKVADVAVIARNQSDQQFLAQMLNQAGFQASSHKSSDMLQQQSCQHRAMVICHRTDDRNQPNVPHTTNGQRIVVLSDCNAESVIVNALEQGAHHYFDLEESQAVLQARLEAALRQHSVQKRRILEVEPFRFNLERRSVTRDGRLINLSPKEYEFAYYLFANRHRIVVNSELMTSVWSLPSSMDARRIDTAACRVRKKMLLSETADGWNLRRIRRVGYELLWCGEMQKPDASQLNQVDEQVVGDSANDSRRSDTTVLKVAEPSVETA